MKNEKQVAKKRSQSKARNVDDSGRKRGPKGEEKGLRETQKTT